MRRVRGYRKRPHLISGRRRFCKKNAGPKEPQRNPKAPKSTAPAGQKTAPAAFLARQRTALFLEFIALGPFFVDPGIVGRPHDRDHRRNAGWGGFRDVLFQYVLARAEQ